ncbi:MAG: hypothetical protein HFACDABA_01389 [Anaerolineales bacterium]|nr:hypothetical protein [Anaerolineales bacterium]
MSPLLKRILLSLLIGVAIGAAANEISFQTLREVNRPPQTVTLVVPPGAAAQVARGEQPPAIPKDMIFIVGDVLVVKNEDTVAHELGPLFIPPDSSASLEFSSEESYSYSCTFQAGSRFGLDVREPVTPSTRLLGILLSGVPLGGLIAVYSVIVRPLAPKKEKEEQA